MYYNGLGVPKDKNKAKELYKQAAVSDKNAKVLLEELELEERQERQKQQQEKQEQQHKDGNISDEIS